MLQFASYPALVMGLCLSGLLWGLSEKARANELRPNVVLVVTDDQGYGDLGYHGNAMIQTPNLDRFAGQSVRFTNFHVDPTCSETRAALLTGKYSCQVGVWHTVMGRSILRSGEQTLAEALAAAGYRTGIFGKWHLGDNYPYRPQDRGFHQSLVHGGGGVGQTPDHWANDYFDDTYFRNGLPEPQAGYCTDVFFHAAMEFIDEHRDQPFFCYLATNAPHSPYHVPERYSQAYLQRGVPQPMANFYGMITNIDENLGRLLECIDELQLRERTLVIFMTDNGTAAGVMPSRREPMGEIAAGDRAQPEIRWRGFNAGMRGQKGSPYEGGHRVPCFIRLPEATSSEGRDQHELTAHFDLFPTILELCGVECTESLSGVSLVPLLRGDRPFPERTLFVHSQRVDEPQKWRNTAVMTSRWRYINGRELYDVREDPGQQHDLAARHPDVIEQLTEQYDAWWNSLVPSFDQAVRIPLAPAAVPVTLLTCHDWHAPIEQVPWNQTLVARDPAANGFWAVEIPAEGTYLFTLRARPSGVEYAFRPGAARLVLGDVAASASLPEGESAVTLEAHLKPGPTQLQTWIDEDGLPSRGAYYVEVRRAP